MASRHRSYTSYSEENGKLVPSIEPQEKDVKVKGIEDTNTVITINVVKKDDIKEKLKTLSANEKLPRLP
jgi:hypothetical protein